MVSSQLSRPRSSVIPQQNGPDAPQHRPVKRPEIMSNNPGKDTATGPPINGITIPTMTRHIEQAASQTRQQPQPAISQIVGLFRSMSLNGWMEEAKTQPIPNRLFGDFWFEGEICFMFAETNQGKSVAAVQIGDAISRGRTITGFPLEAPAQLVIIFDFELVAKQLEKRYSEKYTNHYQWSENFIRVELNPGADLPSGLTFEEYLTESIEELIQQTGAKVVILDNLTFLRADTESAKDAAPLMKMLLALKRRHGLSMLIVGHTPKRDSSRPLTRNDLQGSSRLAQFADSMFAIGGSVRDPKVKYFKQIKVRAVEYRYDADNVMVCELSQPYNFLGFQFRDFGREADHLRPEVEADAGRAKYEQIKESRAKGLQGDALARSVGLSKGRVSQIEKDYGSKSDPDTEFTPGLVD
jgi:hypothetical protein